MSSSLSLLHFVQLLFSGSCLSFSYTFNLFSLSLFSFFLVQRDGESLPITSIFPSTSTFLDITRIQCRCFCSSGERSRGGQSTASSLHCRRLSAGTLLTYSGSRVIQSTKCRIHDGWCALAVIHNQETFSLWGAISCNRPFESICLPLSSQRCWKSNERMMHKQWKRLLKRVDQNHLYIQYTLCSITRQH